MQLDSKPVVKMILASFFLALGIVLPFVTGNVAFLGSKFLPMHIPVLLCGFICGWKYGVLVGFILPILRATLVGMPPLFPVAFTMSFELAAYGLFAGFFYQRLQKKTINIYISLLLAMFVGRIVWGLVSLSLAPSVGIPFTFELFLTGAFVFALPGILFQIIFIPVMILIMRKNEVLAPYLT